MKVILACEGKLPGFEPGSYFTECDMYSAIKEYKRLKRHEKDELYLFDLLS